MPKKSKVPKKAKSCPQCAMGRGGAPVMKRGLGGDILGGIGGKFFGAPGGNIGRGVGDLLGGLFGLKKGGRVPGGSGVF
jgi:hypothetical protein